MPFGIQISTDMFKEVEKRLKYRFWDKERERSNHGKAIVDAAKGTRRFCPSFPPHSDIVWIGPPHDKVKAYGCRWCGAYASEPEIKDRGLDFDACPDWIIYEIFNLDLERKREGKFVG